MTAGNDRLTAALGVLHPPVPRLAPDVRAFLAAVADLRERFPHPIDRAIACGFAADRVGFAFACGYQAAISALVPSLDPSRIASFCVTEETGNHPRAIHTRLVAGGSEYTLSGGKRWSTMAPLAEVLVVIATEGEGEGGRPRLRAVRVERGAPGLTVRQLPETPFVPEVPHAELALENVRISPDALLPGDGYTEYTKAFRTVEDLHVNAGVLAYLLSVVARFGFPESVRERGVALLVTARALGDADPRSPETHLALAGLLEQVARLVTEIEPEWARVEDAERQRWHRDRALVQVAGKAREQRRVRAWQDLAQRYESEAP